MMTDSYSKVTLLFNLQRLIQKVVHFVLIIFNHQACKRTNEQKQIIFDEGAVPNLVKWLQSMENKLIEAAVRIILELTYGTGTQKQVIINEGVIPRLVELLQLPSTPNFTKKMILEIFVEKANGTNEQTYEVFQTDVIPCFIDLLDSDNEVIAEEAARALSHMVRLEGATSLANYANGTIEQKQIVINRGAVPHLINCLVSTSEQHAVYEQASLALANIAKGTNRQKQAIIDANGVPHLINCLISTTGNVREQVSLALANIAKGTNRQIQTVVLQLLLLLQEDNLFNCQQSVYTLVKIARGTDEQKKVLIDEGVTARLVQLFSLTEKFTRNMRLEPDIQILIDRNVIHLLVEQSRIGDFQLSYFDIKGNILQILIEIIRRTNQQMRMLIDEGVIPHLVELFESLLTFYFVKRKGNFLYSFSYFYIARYLFDERKMAIWYWSPMSSTNVSIRTFRTLGSQLDSVIQLLFDLLESDNADIAVEAARGLFNILDGIEEEADEDIEAGIIPRLIYLLGSHNAVIVVEIARGLSNLLGGTEKQINQVIRAGVIPRFIDLLESKNEVVTEEVAIGLSNAAAGTEKQINLVIDAIPKLITLLRLPHSPVHVQALKALANIAGRSNQQKDSVTEALPHLPSFLTLERPVICEYSCRLIAGVAAGDPNQKQKIIDENLLMPLKNLLDPSSPLICEQAARTFANIAAGTPQQKWLILNSAVGSFIELLEDENVLICEQAVRALANIAVGSIELRDEVIESGAQLFCKCCFPEK
uniref:Uncharacterized protein n=1 Tax=Panagrolaimus sp. JU765 TaxID=591449 RepID=A0AC34RCG7_9BILA